MKKMHRLAVAVALGCLTAFAEDLSGLPDVDGKWTWYDEITQNTRVWLSDMTCAYWTKNAADGDYYVFHTQRGYSDSIVPDPIPGYKFSRWLVQMQLVDYFNNTVMLYAVFEKLPGYIVQFHVNDGTPSDPFSQRKIYPATVSEMSDQAFSYGVAQNLNPCVFKRPGYTFRGWKRYDVAIDVPYADGGSLCLSKTDTSYDAYQLYAAWEPKTVTITFDFQGWPAGKNHTTTYTVGEKFGEGEWHYDWGPAYNVDGWFTANGEEVSSTDYVPTKDTTLYLRFSRKEYTIKFDANGGTGTMASKTFPYNVATALPANQFVNSGYRFKGWSTTENGDVEFTDGQQVKQIKSMAGLTTLTVTLYAVWEPLGQLITVTFDPMEGVAEFTERTYVANQPYGRLPSVTREGYGFRGWRTQPGGGTVVDADTFAKTSVTKLYAWLESASYPISYLGTRGATNPNPTTYAIEDEIRFVPLPDVAGYSFVRWEPQMIARGSTGARTVTAIWQAATYPVVYLPGRNGAGDAAREDKTHGEPLMLQGALFTRANYRQVGWSVSDGGAKKYDLGAVYSANAALTLYPVWAELPTYTITYEPGYYGTGETVVDRHYVGTPTTLRGALFTREGCLQSGWTTVDGEFKTHAFGETYGADGDLTLYATWIAPREEDYRYKIVDGEAWITGYKGSEADILIPSKIAGYPVVGIDDYALCSGWCSCQLKSVIVPEGVRTLGRHVWDGMYSLVSVTLPDSLERIGEYGFNRCSSLVSVTMPAGVVEIGKSAFCDCSSLSTMAIPPRVRKICDNTFYGCSSLASVTIPASVLEIGNSAFRGCGNLTRVDLENGVTSFGYGVFLDCKSLESIVFPESVISIGNQIFVGCTDLEEVVFLGGRPEIRNLGGVGLVSLNAPSTCVFYALSEKNGWGVLPTTWDYRTVKGPMLNFPCTVMFDPNGGTGTMADLVCESGDKVYQLPRCSFTPPEGKRFAGWRSMLGRRYDNGMLVFGLRSLGGIVMMTAIWE